MKNERLDNISEIKSLILEELEKCKDEYVYPNLCGIKKEKNGIDLILSLSLNIIAKEGVSVQNALGQIESNY